MTRSSPRLIEHHRGITVFFLTYYVGLVAYGVATNGARTVFYALFMAIAAVLVMRIYATNDLSSIVLWGCFLGLAHMMGASRDRRPRDL